MEAEAAPAVVELGLKRDDPPRIKPPAPCISYSGTKFGIDIHLVCNGARALPFIMSNVLLTCAEMDSCKRSVSPCVEHPLGMLYKTGRSALVTVRQREYCPRSH